MAISAEHRSKFATLHRQWWRLQMSEKFSSGMKNSKQTNQHRIGEVPNAYTQLFEEIIMLSTWSCPCSLPSRHCLLIWASASADMIIVHVTWYCQTMSPSINDCLNIAPCIVYYILNDQLSFYFARLFLVSTSVKVVSIMLCSLVLHLLWWNWLSVSI